MSRLIDLAPSMDDAEREVRIEALRRVMASAPTDSRRRLALAQMNDEIRGRSPAMVAAMERAKRL